MNRSSHSRLDRLQGLLPVMVLAFVLFFVSLGARDLWNPNEPTYGRAVVEMFESGNWLIPTVNDKVFAEKPILYYWLALLASSAYGEVNELTLRIPSAIAGCCSVALTYFLVLPYVGRRRAALASLLFITLYQVFWASRAVQMDVWVMCSTLGVLLPLTRMLDFGASPRLAWCLAGIAAGIGFTAKGPVTWILPAVVFGAYVVARKRIRKVASGPLWIPVVVALLVGSPWYLMLWFQGQTDFIHEVLIRQNFYRLTDAWDHVQPWWYYLEYLWIDYLPWAFFLPAAWWLRPKDEHEANLHTLSWWWIVGMVGFFSLSESKRAPYILPIAPAVAILAAGVIDRWLSRTWSSKLAGAESSGSGLSGMWYRRSARRPAYGAFIFLAVLFSAASIYLLGPWLKSRGDVPAHLGPIANGLGIWLLLSSLVVWVGILNARRVPALAPIGLFSTMLGVYVLAAVWALPAADANKSARDFSAEVARLIDEDGRALASFDFWDWRAGYSYYMSRPIENLKSREQLKDFWQQPKPVYILVEEESEPKLRKILPGAEAVLEGRIGGRRAMLFSRSKPSSDAVAQLDEP